MRSSFSERRSIPHLGYLTLDWPDVDQPRMRSVMANGQSDVPASETIELQELGLKYNGVWHSNGVKRTGGRIWLPSSSLVMRVNSTVTLATAGAWDARRAKTAGIDATR